MDRSCMSLEIYKVKKGIQLLFVYKCTLNPLEGKFMIRNNYDEWRLLMGFFSLAILRSLI
jgi:hypothetical protein